MDLVNLLSAPALAVLTGALACTAPDGHPALHPPPTAITNVTVIDGSGRTPMQNVTVLVWQRRIADIFPSGSRTLPQGAERIDGSGRYLIPGLIDSHIHTATIEERPREMMEAILRNALLGGVTAARDMGGRGSNVRAYAMRAAREETGWPRIYYSAAFAGPGMWFEGRRGAYMAEGGRPGEQPLVRLIDGSTDIGGAVAGARAAGATGIKLYGGIPPAIIERITEEAHRAGMRVWAHLAIDPGMPGEVVNAGVDAVSHADMFIRQVLPWPAPSVPAESARAQRELAFARTPVDTAPISAVLQAMARRGTSLDATLFIMQPRPEGSALLVDFRGPLFDFATAMVRRAHEAGVPVVAGTDHLGGASPNIHAELQLLVERGGLTPMQALQAATSNAARMLGVSDSLGTIERGKLADLVLLRANPLDDIANTLSVEAVLKGGILYRPPAPVPAPPGARAPSYRRQ